MVKVIIECILMLLQAVEPTPKHHVTPTVNWISADSLSKIYANNPRPILVDVYTDWCQYCRLMDKTTWRNDSVIAYLTPNFYTVKLNAETKNDLEWLGETFSYHPNYKVHMLAAKLLEGNMVYPSTVIIPPNGATPIVLRGMLTVAETAPILTYFGSKAYLTTTWKEYKANFKGNWK